MNNNYIYPQTSDENWHSKINNKLEFREAFNNDPIEISSLQHSNASIAYDKDYFSLKSHQLFVRNFLSQHTPYNNLLLYHGLGTGKTCSAIGIAFEKIKYMIQTNKKQKIVVICGENVKENFKKQIFTEDKLYMVNDVWVLNTCVGHELMSIINPNNIVNPLNIKNDNNYEKNSKKIIVHNIKKFIDSWFDFIGYQTFSNICGNIDSMNEDTMKFKLKMKSLLDRFDHSLMIIDEVHNIRMTEDDKRSAIKLRTLVQYTKNLKLLLLSATPMFDSYEEIGWLINIMNINDDKTPIELKNVFDKNGNFITNKYKNEIGKDLFIRKIKNYISFVEGGNPFTFPFRLYPKEFEPNKSSLLLKSYPKTSWNNTKINKFENKIIDYYTIEMNKDGIQQQFYDHCVKHMKYDGSDHKHQILSYISNIVFISNNEKFNLDTLQNNYNEYLGETGFSKMFSGNIKKIPLKLKDKYSDFFDMTNLKNVGTKIHNICQRILNNEEGISLVYSEKLYGGIFPMALALETMGFVRYDNDDFLDTNKNKTKFKKQRKYMIISGDDFLSPKKKISKHITSVVNSNNLHGNNIEVIIISRTGSEGIDFKFIRNIYIIDPWYNINRLEQIIGRGIREDSHKLLPFEKRNCSIFMYSLYSKKVETIDMYIYRTAEGKIKKIGNILRLLKENSVDCLLSSKENIIYDENIKIELINTYNQTIEYYVKKKPYSPQCDFLENCEYICNDTNMKHKSVDESTYSINNAIINLNDIKFIIRDLFKEKGFYSKYELFLHINHRKSYSLEQLELALESMTNNPYEIIFDKHDRKGNLKQYNDIYVFHPLEITSETVSYENLNKPLLHKNLYVELTSDENIIEDESSDASEEYQVFFNNVTDYLKKIKNFVYRIDDYLNDNYLDKEEKEQLYPELRNDIIIEKIVIKMLYEKLDKQQKIAFLNHKDSILNKIIDEYTYDVELLNNNNKIIETKVLIIDYEDDWVFFVKNGSKWEISKESSYILEQLMENENLKIMYNKINNNDSKLYGYCQKNKNEIVFKIYKKGNTKIINKNCKTIDEIEQKYIFNNIFDDNKLNIEEMAKYTLKKDKDKKTKRLKVTIEDKCMLFEYLFRYKQMFSSDKIYFISFDNIFIKNIKMN